MKNLAKGSVLLGLILALIGISFFFQPKKAEAVTIAIDSQEIIQKETIQKTDKVNQSEVTEITISTEEPNKENEANLSEARSFRATAYCLRGRTASGGSVRRGIVAADPRVLPLGTRINLSAGSYSGTYTVADTGGRIRGNILDIWVPSCAEANRFGRRTVKVSVVSKRKKR